MELTADIRKDMASKGYVYYKPSKKYPANGGLKQLCRDLANADASELEFDTNAYECHIRLGFIDPSNATA